MELHTYQNQEQQVNAIVSHLVGIVNTILKTKDHVVIALSGGKSPITLFNKLSNTNLNFSKIIFTLVDERVIDATSEDSNEKLVKTYLLQNKATQAKFIGLYQKNATPEAMAIIADKQIPNIDIAILGMGEDGHTASIFPDCKELNQALDLNNKMQYIVTTPISAKYSRLSMTLKAITQTPHLILSVAGIIKFKILTEASHGNNYNYPISYVLSNNPNLQIFWHE